MYSVSELLHFESVLKLLRFKIECVIYLMLIIVVNFAFILDLLLQLPNRWCSAAYNHIRSNYLFKIYKNNILSILL